MTIDIARSVKKMFVDGKWTESESGQLFEATSPATGEVIGQVPKGTRADAQRAIEAAHFSFLTKSFPAFGWDWVERKNTMASFPILPLWRRH